MSGPPGETGTGVPAGASDSILSPAVTFPCGSCGGHGTWHAGRQDVVCASCGAAVPLPPAPAGSVDRVDIVPLLRDRANSGRDWQPTATNVRCATCQAVTRLEAGVAAARCQSCGAASLVVIDQSGAPISPAGVVPFALSEADAREAVRRWIAERVRLDIGRARTAAIDLRPVYLPWWDFFAHVNCPWRMETERRGQDGTVERIVKEGTVDLDLEEPLPGVRSPLDALLTKAADWNLASARPFDARYLAGATVEHYTVNLWDGWDAAHARMQGRLEKALRADAGNWLLVPEHGWAWWSRESARLVLVPVFVGSCVVRGQDTPVVVNGATGVVAGHWPWSTAAVLRGVVVLAVLAAAAVGVVWGTWTLLKSVGFQPLW